MEVSCLKKSNIGLLYNHCFPCSEITPLVIFQLLLLAISETFALLVKWEIIKRAKMYFFIFLLIGYLH